MYYRETCKMYVLPLLDFNQTSLSTTVLLLIVFIIAMKLANDRSIGQTKIRETRTRL